jgi:hypothetical protein
MTHTRFAFPLVGRYGKGACRVLVSYFLDMMDASTSSSLSALSREVLTQLRQPPGHARRIRRLIAKRATPAAQPKIRGYPVQLCEVVTKYSLQNLSFGDVMRRVNTELKGLCEAVPGLWVDFQRKATQTGWVDLPEKFVRNVAGYCGIRLFATRKKGSQETDASKDWCVMSVLFIRQHLRRFQIRPPIPTTMDVSLARNKHADTIAHSAEPRPTFDVPGRLWQNLLPYVSDHVLSLLQQADIDAFNYAFYNSVPGLILSPTTGPLARNPIVFASTAHYDERHQQQKFGSKTRKVKVLIDPRSGRLLSNPQALYEHTVKFPAEWRGSHGVCLTRNADGSFDGSRFPNYEYTGCMMVGPNAFDKLCCCACAAARTYASPATARTHNAWVFEPCVRCNDRGRDVMRPPRAVVVQVSNFGSLIGVHNSCLTALRKDNFSLGPADFLFHREFADDDDGSGTVRLLSFRTEQIAASAAQCLRQTNISWAVKIIKEADVCGHNIPGAFHCARRAGIAQTLRATGHSKSKATRSVDVRDLIDHIKRHADAVYGHDAHFLNHDPLSTMFSKAALQYAKNIGFDPNKKWWVYIDEGEQAFEHELAELTRREASRLPAPIELHRVLQSGLRVQVQQNGAAWVDGVVDKVGLVSHAEVVQDNGGAKVTMHHGPQPSVKYGDDSCEMNVPLHRMRVHPDVTWSELAVLGGAAPLAPALVPGPPQPPVAFADSDGDTSELRLDPLNGCMQWWGTAVCKRRTSMTCYVTRVKQLIWETTGNQHVLFSFVDDNGQQVPRAVIVPASTSDVKRGGDGRGRRKQRGAAAATTTPTPPTTTTTNTRGAGAAGAGRDFAYKEVDCRAVQGRRGAVHRATRRCCGRGAGPTGRTGRGTWNPS